MTTLCILGGVVVQDDVDRPPGGDLLLDLVEERDELLLPVSQERPHTIAVATTHMRVDN